MKEIKLPKYIIKELSKASDYVNKSDLCIFKFEQWVKENVDKEFDFGRLRGESSNEYNSNDELTDIEYGKGVNEDTVERIESVLNTWVEEISK